VGHTDDLLTGLAQLTANAGLALYQPETPYAQGDTGIGLGELPRSCDKALAIADYTTIDAVPDQPMTTVRVNALFRGLPNDRTSMLDFRDDVYQLWQNLIHQQFGSFGLTQCLRISSLPLGQDDHDRWLMSDNYEIRRPHLTNPGRRHAVSIEADLHRCGPLGRAHRRHLRRQSR
jgi:hypothetical protein